MKTTSTRHNLENTSFLPPVSVVNERLVLIFMEKWPVIKTAGLGPNGLHQLHALGLKQVIPFTGLLTCVYSYLNHKPIKTVKAEKSIFLVYHDTEYAETILSCEIKNDIY